MNIKWDDTNSRTLNAGFFRVDATRAEISLLFALDDLQRLDEQGRITIPFSDRIVLSPFVAKQLAIALNQFLGGDEMQLTASVLSPTPEVPQPIPKEQKSQKSANRLLQLLGTLDTRAYLEHSFKVIPGKILANRFLCGIDLKSMPGDSTERIISLCEGLGMAVHLRASMRDRLREASSVHFGFEEGEDACLYKVYLEFLGQVREKIGDNREMCTPVLLFLAFKWDAWQNARNTITSYTLHPWISVSDILAKTVNNLKIAIDGTALTALEDIIRLAAERTPLHDLIYLEVTEKGNPRRSFDLNVYRAGLHMGEIYPLLAEIAQRFSVSYQEFHDLYEPLKRQRFGHLAGGIGRDGKAFMTLYYGAENVRFNRVEAPAPPDGIAAAPATFPDHTPIVIQTTPAGGFLIDLVKSLQVPFGVERSFKIANRTLLADRFLLGFQKKDAAAKEEHILKICRDLKMPDNFLEEFRTHLHQANILLFGYDGNPTTPLYKAYLELSSRLGDVVPGRPETLKPFIIHRGFKWGVGDPAQKIRAYYNCFPLLPVDVMLKRISGGFSSPVTNAAKIVEDIITLVANRTAPGGLLYVETSEGDNPRSSFDINLYRANLRVMEVYPYLLAMARHYSVPMSPFRELYEKSKELILGHLTGGVDREGRDFLTVYFSEKGSTGKAGK